MKIFYRTLIFGALFLLGYTFSVAQIFEEVATTISTSYNPQGKWADIDNDGDLDIILTDNNGSHSYENTGTDFQLIANSGLPNSLSNTFSAGDYNGDGLVDFAFGYPINKVYKNIGNKSFEAIPFVFSNFYVPQWGDVDNDGDLDLLCVNLVYYNNGNDDFTYQFIGSSGGQFDCAWVDYDNDGDLDQINLSGGGSHVSFLLRNDGDGVFTKSGFNFYGFGGGGWGTNYGDEGNGWDNCSVDAGDFNQDGKMDFIVTGNTRDNGPSNPEVSTVIYQNFGPDQLHIIGGKSDQLFDQLETGRTSSTRSIKGVRDGSVDWGDYDNDGLSDFILTGQDEDNNAQTFLYKNIDKDSFALVNTLLPNMANGFAAWGDYDNDGDLDLMISGQRLVNFNWINETRLFKNTLNDLPVNSPPSPPINLQTSIFKDSVIFTWLPSLLDSTTFSGHSYNLRLGSESGKEDIFPSNADGSSGKRKIVEIGNSGQRIFHYIKGLEKGTTYFASVQAINASFQASPFSQELEFENLARPIIVFEYFPDQLTYGVSNNKIGLDVLDNIGLLKYEFHYKGITETVWKRKDSIFNSIEKTAKIEEIIPKEMFDEQGLEYFFKVYNVDSIDVNTDTTYSYLRFSDGNRVLSDLIKGTNNVSSYQIISIPLHFDNSTLRRNVLSGLGRVDSTLWRLYHYADGKNTELKHDTDSIAPGKGYWLIIRDNQDISFSESTNLPGNQKDPYEWILKPGWNQVGNPYLFDIDWDDIKSGNSTIFNSQSKFYLFDGGYIADENIIPKWRGGFVRVDGINEVQVKVPPKPAAQNGRKAEEEGWRISLNLDSKFVKDYLGKIGMRKNASEDYGHEDIIHPPNLQDYLFIDFENLSTNQKTVTGSIIDEKENYVWEFSVNSNQNETANMTWEIPVHFPRSKNLLLWDEITKEVVDMLNTNNYSFFTNKKRQFKIIFGDDSYLNTQLNIVSAKAGNPYPNPFYNQINVPLYLPSSSGDYHVTIELIDLQGKTMGRRDFQNIDSGYRIISYYPNTNNSSGIVIQKVKIVGKDFQEIFIHKLSGIN